MMNFMKFLLPTFLFTSLAFADDGAGGEGDAGDPLDLGERQWNRETEDEMDEQIIKDLEAEEKKKAGGSDEEDDEEFEDEEEEENDDDDDSKSDKDESEEGDSEENDEDAEEDDSEEDGDDDDEEDDDDSDEEELIDNRAKKLAEKYKIDMTDAKELAKSDKAIADKYGSDPLEIAHALRSLQGRFTRVQQATIEHQARMSNPYDYQEDKVVATDPKTGEKKEVSKEEVVKRYREQFANDKELEKMSDDEIYREAKRRNAEWAQRRFKAARDEVKKKAAKVKTDIVSNIPDNLKPYTAEIERIAENLDDNVLAGEGFDKELPYLLVKGRYADDMIKEAEKRGHKRGLKNLKLVKKKGDKGSSEGKSVKKSSRYGGLLTKAQKREALDMFSDDPISDEKKFKHYVEINDIKKKK